MANIPTRKPLPPELQALATEYLGFETLETRNSDSLDFKEIAVWDVYTVLQRAFELGQQSKQIVPS